MTDKKKKNLARLLLLICNPKLADRATKLYADDNIPLHFRVSAAGTASNEMRDILGLDSVEKVALLSLLPRDIAKDTLVRLRRSLRMDTTNSGIAFTIPLTAVSKLVLRI